VVRERQLSGAIAVQVGHRDAIGIKAGLDVDAVAFDVISVLPACGCWRRCSGQRVHRCREHDAVGYRPVHRIFGVCGQSEENGRLVTVAVGEPQRVDDWPNK